jgi:hypothetical protein
MLRIGIIDDSLPSKYVNSLYFSFTTVISIGYGDIVSTNLLERVISILAMIVGAGLYAFNLNDISRIVSNFHELANDYK